MFVPIRPAVGGVAKPMNWMADWRMMVGRNGIGARTTDISDGTAIPVLAFEITADVPYTVYDISDRLRYHGWQVPAYTMPDNATDVAVLRIVVREGFTLDLAEALIKHLKAACDDPQANPPMKSAEQAGFAH